MHEREDRRADIEGDARSSLLTHRRGQKSRRSRRGCAPSPFDRDKHVLRVLPQPDRTDPTRYRGELHPSFVGLPESGKARTGIAPTSLACSPSPGTTSQRPPALRRGARDPEAARTARSPVPRSVRSRAKRASSHVWGPPHARAPLRLERISLLGRVSRASSDQRHTPAYFEALDDVLAHQPLSALKAYLRYDMLRSLWSALGPEFVREFLREYGEHRRHVARSAVSRP